MYMANALGVGVGGWRWGLPLGVGVGGNTNVNVRVGGDAIAFLDTNMLVLPTRGPNARTQREWFCVAVEYRLNGSKYSKLKKNNRNITIQGN